MLENIYKGLEFLIVVLNVSTTLVKGISIVFLIFNDPLTKQLSLT